MYKIGEFAKLAHVTIKAVRHYERIGLLKPAWIDRFSGYRYYTDIQLEQIHRIQAYKDLGFPLRQVRLLLAKSLPVDQMVRLLETRRAEVAFQIEQEQARLSRVESHICELTALSLQQPLSLPSKEFTMTFTLKNHPALTLVGLRYEGKNENGEITHLWDEFNPRVPEIKHKINDAAYGYCAMLPDAPDGVFEYLAAFAVTKVDNLPQDMVIRQVPAATYAVFAMVGGKEGIPAVYQKAYQEDLPAAGYKPAGGFDMEVYGEEFKFFTPDSIMYIWIPVEKV